MITNSPVFKALLSVIFLFFSIAVFGQTTSSKQNLTKEEVKEKLVQFHKENNTYKSPRKIPKRNVSRTTETISLDALKKRNIKTVNPVHIKRNGKVEVINKPNTQN